MKKDLQLVFLIIGAFVGGGFASGREIVIYFSKYGYISVLFCVLSGVLFYFFVKLFLLLSHKNTNDYCYKCVMFKKRFSLKPCLTLCNFVLIASMFAGLFELGNIFSHFMGVLFQIIGFVFSFVILRRGVNGLEKLNFYLIPVLLLTLIMIIILNFFKLNTIEVMTQNNANVFFTSSLYMFFNILSLSMFLLEIGKNYNIKQIKRCSVISAITLASFLVVINLFFVTFYNTVQNLTLPTITLAYNIGKGVGFIMVVAVFIAMFTTLLSTTFSVKQFFANRCSNDFSTLLTLFVGYLLSLFGFDKIVSKLYILLGVIGFIFCLYVLCAKRNKSVFAHEN